MNLEAIIKSIKIDETNKFINIDKTEPIPKVPYQIGIIAKRITEGIKDPRVKAYALHTWVVDNIKYNITTNDNFYDASAIVYSLQKKAGTCYSMTHLYVALAKSINLDARIAKVIVDCDGKEMGSPGHICSMVDFVKEHLYFDPAYKNGDAKHKQINYFSREDTNKEIIDDILTPYSSVLKVFEQKKDYKAQLDCCSKVLSLFPDNQKFKLKKQKILTDAGIKNLENKKFKNASACFKAVLEIDPSNDFAKRNLELLTKS